VSPPEPIPDQAVPQPTPPPALLRTAPASSPSFDLARQPQARSRERAGPVGPAFTPQPGDSQRIAGSGPNGEPLYAARWYREPTNGELAGYLSTASGPGWGLINCQTAPQFRVENCVLVDEWPSGSQIGRAVLAAAWQFKVRPPQIGGQPQVGEWVRIRIDYDLRREP
jgi:protein TonB